MQHKKQAVYWLTIFAMLFATVGIFPAMASVAPTLAAISSPSTVAAVSSAIRTMNARQGPATPPEDIFPLPSNPPKLGEEGEDPDRPEERADAFYSRRTAGDPNIGFTMGQAASLRSLAAQQVTVMKARQAQNPTGPLALGGAWTPIGPDPILQVDRSGSEFVAQAGRIGALAIRSTPPYTMYLGAAQGGVWVSTPGSQLWTPKTDYLPSLAIGALALAPSNEDIVYVGTGEGALSGDSYFGNGILKSINGGDTFFKVSASGYFTNVSISKLAVNPNNPDILYAGTLRGRGGARRTSPPDASPFGVYKSTDGGVNWTLVLTTSTNVLSIQKGVGDLALDPQNPQVIYASIVGQGISKTVDGGATWFSVMNGLPTTADYSLAPTRFALALSHPSAAVSATLYSGFEWYDTSFGYHPSTVWKSTDEGGSWSEVNTAVVGGYCGYEPDLTQCYYDNVVAADPNNPNVVFAAGVWDYNGANGAPDTSGGVYRSMDGGATWTDLGYGTHPDFHAVTFMDSAVSGFTGTVMIGNDGGAWISDDYGGRLSAGDPITAVTWVDLNGFTPPTNTAGAFGYGLQIAQFTSMAQNPSNNRAYGGTQDNGTLRKFNTAGPTPWVDFTSGDGGQTLVDPTNPNYVYGTYYGISPYRFTDGMASFTGNQAYIRSGIKTSDRSDFYIPWIMDPGNTSRLYLGTYRVYRTDNAQAAAASGVLWHAISGDLTSGCTGSAPNGGRGCVITAFGKSAGSPALYVGNMEGWVWVAADSTVAAPTWTRVDDTSLMPDRPVAAIAVDRSNYRVAYVGYNGFNAATPNQPGHVFKTEDAGQTWTNVSGNLPDVPVNSIVIDPSYPHTLYIGTDVGPMVSVDDGMTWSPLGTDFPVTAIWQLDLNAFTRQLATGTHGRGAWRLADPTPVAALQISKHDAGIPVGPGNQLNYTVRVENWGNAEATGVVITDVVPANTSFITAGSGGTFNGTDIVWNVTSVPTATATGPAGGLVPGNVEVTFTVQITNVGVMGGSVITNDGYLVTSAEGPSAVGSPQYVTLAPEHGVSITPASQGDTGKPGQVMTYVVSINNISINADAYNLTVNGNNWPTTFWDPSFTTQITQTANISSSSSAQVGVKVTIPLGVANAAMDIPTLMATSEADPLASGSATVKTTAATVHVLLVDDDDGDPDVEGYYQAALDATGVPYDYWDILRDGVLTANNIMAHDTIIWFTGGSYPAPLAAYESKLATFLNGGGKLFMSGQDILDNPGGYTSFALNYLHIASWNNGTQNDTGTTLASGIITSPLTSGLGDLSVDVDAVGLSDYSDWITPDALAQPAFRDDAGRTNALTADTGTYKVIFLAFPFEAISNSCDRADVMARIIQWLMGGAIGPVCGTLSGPTSSQPNVSQTFLASVHPAISAATPLTYKWQADDFSPFSYIDGLNTGSIFSWSMLGTKAIAVTATNAAAVGARAMLAGTNETPPVTTTTASGVVIFTYNQATHTLHYEMATYGLTGVTASHIHRGAPGVPGPIAYPLTTPVTGTSVGNVVLSAADEALLFSGDLYVNVHTTAHPSGEIRGQIAVTGGGRLTLSDTITIEYPNKLYLPLVLK